MAVAGVPTMEWDIEAVCPDCDRSTALTLRFAGGRMPTGGAMALEALYRECGHVRTLPPAKLGSRASR